MPLSRTYRLMAYFAHSTLVLYGASITTHPDMTVAEFLAVNAATCARVADEARNRMGYELSHEQMCRGAYAYLCGVYHPQAVGVMPATG